MENENDEENEENENENEWNYEHEMIPAKKEDPNCCSDDYCSWKAVPGTTKCKMHGGISILEKTNALNVRNYRLGQWNARVNEFAKSPAIKSLRDEVGIARMTLEAILTKCRDVNQIFLNSNKIADMLTRIDKLVTSCNRLEDKLGYTIDKASVISISTQIIEVISIHVTSDVLETITQEISQIIMEPSPINERRTSNN